MSKEWLEKLEMEKQRYINKKECEMANELHALNLRIRLLLKNVVTPEQLQAVLNEIQEVRI